MQRTARDELLDEVREPALVAGAEHGDHVRVGDLLGRGDLALEAADEDLVLRELRGHDLDRDGVAAVGDAFEDDPHSATPDGPGDPVGPYGIARPGLECDLRHTSARKHNGSTSRPVLTPDLRSAATCAIPVEPGHCG